MKLNYILIFTFIFWYKYSENMECPFSLVTCSMCKKQLHYGSPNFHEVLILVPC